MAGESIDAFLWFKKGRVGQGGTLDDIKGETTDKEHRDKAAMQIRGYTFAFTMQSEGSEEKQGDKGQQELPDPSFQPVQITKSVDTASPLLFKALCVGAKFDEAHISQRKAGHSVGASGGEFWHLEMHGVTIDNVSWATDESGALTETLSLRYEYIKVTYLPQSLHGKLEKTVAPQEHGLRGAEGLKDKNKTQGNGGVGNDPAQVAGLVDKVIAELSRRRLIGPGTGAGGTSQHGR